MIDNGMLKDRAKSILASCQPSATLPTCIYLVILIVFSTISTRLSDIMLGDIFGDMTIEELLAAINEFSASASGELVSVLNGIGWRSVMAWLLGVAVSALTQVFNVGYCSYALKLSRGVQTKYGDLLDGFNHFFKILALYIVTSLFVYLWSLLFIIPGIAASYRYRQAYYILLENPNITVMEALRRSKAVMRGHKLELFFLDVSFIGWYFLCIITMNILYIWKMPYFEVTYANFYNLVSGRDWWSDDGGRSWKV